MPLLARPRADTWLDRFGAPAPVCAVRLRQAVRDGADPATVREAAESLGVLRAQQGRAVSGLLEDVQALREQAGVPVATADRVVGWAVAAYVAELTAMLGERATRDPLTGLPNRAAFDEALAQEVAAAARTSPPTLLLVDLDRFKLVNDTDGHLAGDAVLEAVAEVLRSHVRPTDLVCRLGGDEFTVLLPRCAPARGLQVARRLLTAARKEPGLSSPGARVTLSIGLGWAAAPHDGEGLVALADTALYEAKAAGGDAVVSRVDGAGPGS